MTAPSLGLAAAPAAGAGRPGRRALKALRRRTVAALTAAVLAAAICAGGPACASAQERAADRSLQVGEAEVWGLAESLFAEGEYYRAITEYKRLMSYFPGSAHEATAQERIAQALLLGGEPRQALSHIGARLEKAPEDARDRWRVLQAIGRMDLDKDQPFPGRRGNVEQALTDLKSVSPAYPAFAEV